GERSRATGGGDEDAEAARLRRRRVLLGLLRRAMCRGHDDLAADLQDVEHLHGVEHDVEVGVAAQHDTHANRVRHGRLSCGDVVSCAALRRPMSRRQCMPSNRILAAAVYAPSMASATLVAVAVTPRTRPPEVTSRPSRCAVPAWKTTTPGTRSASAT